MVKSRSIIIHCALITLLPPSAGACQRADTLSALPSPNGEMMLRDRLLDNHDRIVCISRSLSKECSSRTADVYVTDMKSVNDLRVGWDSDNTVRVEINSGKVVRYAPVSKHGSITITLMRN